jgi:hypothetical protein
MNNASDIPESARLQMQADKEARNEAFSDRIKAKLIEDFVNAGLDQTKLKFVDFAKRVAFEAVDPSPVGLTVTFVVAPDASFPDCFKDSLFYKLLNRNSKKGPVEMYCMFHVDNERFSSSFFCLRSFVDRSIKEALQSKDEASLKSNLNTAAEFVHWLFPNVKEFFCENGFWINTVVKANMRNKDLMAATNAFLSEVKFGAFLQLPSCTKPPQQVAVTGNKKRQCLAPAASLDLTPFEKLCVDKRKVLSADDSWVSLLQTIVDPREHPLLGFLRLDPVTLKGVLWAIAKLRAQPGWSPEQTTAVELAAHRLTLPDFATADLTEEAEKLLRELRYKKFLTRNFIHSQSLGNLQDMVVFYFPWGFASSRLSECTELNAVVERLSVCALPVPELFGPSQVDEFLARVEAIGKDSLEAEPVGDSDPAAVASRRDQAALLIIGYAQKFVEGPSSENKQKNFRAKAELYAKLAMDPVVAPLAKNLFALCLLLDDCLIRRGKSVPATDEAKVNLRKEMVAAFLNSRDNVVRSSGRWRAPPAILGALCEMYALGV